MTEEGTRRLEGVWKLLRHISNIAISYQYFLRLSSAFSMTTVLALDFQLFLLPVSFLFRYVTVPLGMLFVTSLFHDSFLLRKLEVDFLQLC